ncbi:MAG: hypothetical protein ACOYU1_10755 [Bacteroidota bacterium]
MRKNKIPSQRRIITFLFFLMITTISFAQPENTGFETVQTYDIQEVRQGIAVDSAYFYAVNTKGIGKYNKKNGKLVREWKDVSGRIIHLDGGVVVNDKLYCAHSNYPEIPMTSSIEIFDTENLEHIGSHSFGIKYGSCTWADYYNDYWWVCFAHYDKFEPQTNKNNRWTVLVKFDETWNELESWTFPAFVLQEFKPMSCSGGSWGPDGNLYVTGHDSAQVYVLQLPEMGSILELKKILKITSEGQGIAWDRYDKSNLYGIIKKNNLVVKSRLLPF